VGIGGVGERDLTSKLQSQRLLIISILPEIISVSSFRIIIFLYDCNCFNRCSLIDCFHQLKLDSSA